MLGSNNTKRTDSYQILQVLASAAQELAQPADVTSTAPSGGKAETCKLVETIGPADPEDWREVVQKRIESKTRRLVRANLCHTMVTWD